MKSYVYIIASNKPSLKTYVGWTSNIIERLKKHNSNKGAKATKGRKWSLVHKETFLNKIDAMKREYIIKNNKTFRDKIRRRIK